MKKGENNEHTQSFKEIPNPRYAEEAAVLRDIGDTTTRREGIPFAFSPLTHLSEGHRELKELSKDRLGAKDIVFYRGTGKGVAALPSRDLDLTGGLAMYVGLHSEVAGASS